MARRQTPTPRQDNPRHRPPHPGTNRPDAVRPEAASPDTARPDAASPDVIQPDTTPPPDTQPDIHPGAQAAQLRADIDAGRTGDKIPAGDPAASPLGTDDEAAGHRPGLQPVDTHAAPEVPPGRAADSTSHPRAGLPTSTGVLAALIAMAVVVVVFLVGLGLVMFHG